MTFRQESFYLPMSDASGTPVGIRTPNLLIRSQTLYPIELRVRDGRREEAGVFAGVQA